MCRSIARIFSGKSKKDRKVYGKFHGAKGHWASMTPGSSTTPAASVPSWTSKGRKSHRTVSDALSIVERLEHRAGKDAEGKTGDGVGIMLQISHRFFAKVADELNISLGNEREYGVGMFFFPRTSICALRP